MWGLLHILKWVQEEEVVKLRAVLNKIIKEDRKAEWTLIITVMYELTVGLF